jgi:hypothetical protein
LLKDICGPKNKRLFVERAENASRFIGFGIPNVEVATACTLNRATLVGFGELSVNSAHNYRVPLPACLERVIDPRSLTIRGKITPGSKVFDRANRTNFPLRPLDRCPNPLHNEANGAPPAGRENGSDLLIFC